MRVAILFAVVAAAAQTTDPAYTALERAYSALQARDYDTAVARFLDAVAADPRRPSIRKDLAYTYLKIGEPALARDQFRDAATLDPADAAASLEYAFLCFETRQQAEARRTFDRLRRTAADAAQRLAAEAAFHNIDDPLAASIDRWQRAIDMGADNFSAHFELATVAEQRDDLGLAAEHYQRAWRLKPAYRSVLVDLGRVLRAQGRAADANAALLAASRGGEPRAAGLARELLPARYPWVAEFRAALALDPANHELRREFAYLLLRMNRDSEAEGEFRILTQNAPGDLLSATQLGFLLYARGERLAAQPLFDHVLAGEDEELANRVRAVLRIPQVLKSRDTSRPASIDARIMAERSLKAGYMKDALHYLEIAHEADPGDFDVMLQLAWTNNILHRDALAFRWFDLARHAPDARVAAEAERGYRNLRAASRPFNVSGWLYPMFSSRWHDAFGYGQIRTELNTGLFVRPYASTRFIGDTQQAPNLSERSIIFALGITTRPWHGFVAWGEAGTAVSYTHRTAAPDYRAGIAYAKTLRPDSSRWFAATTVDALFLSRFDHDFLIYTQNRAGYGPFYWNLNLTTDVRRQDWANFVETGPGVRVPLAESLYLTFNALRGRYLLANPSRRPEFNDLRAGFWYSFMR
ncbi:MAG: tetratricopeptide repeat protein [Acidobacteria bacterium]|nr:tetratricopeptide repeat protein [Acidobacteriota bacterium]